MQMMIMMRQKQSLVLLAVTKTVSIFLRLFWTPLMFSAGKQKIFRHEQHKPPNARFGSFAIHAEDFASVIIFIFRLIRQMRANGRIACLRVYCTIRAGFVNAFLHAPTLDIFSPSGV
ncbi:hypothetical protein [Hominenteromicrobium sp.]|uniref:hypothetical protein n=1 Tax=Hominenteromicrobium sp. TaxID=3073581 RepID=UPI003AF1B631